MLNTENDLYIVYRVVGFENSTDFANPVHFSFNVGLERCTEFMIISLPGRQGLVADPKDDFKWENPGIRNTKKNFTFSLTFYTG